MLVSLTTVIFSCSHSSKSQPGNNAGVNKLWGSGVCSPRTDWTIANSVFRLPGCLTSRAPNGLSVIRRDKVGRKRGSLGDAFERWLEAENLKTNTEVLIFPWTGKIHVKLANLIWIKIGTLYTYGFKLTYGCFNSAFEHLSDIISTNYTSETKS